MLDLFSTELNELKLKNRNPPLWKFLLEIPGGWPIFQLQYHGVPIFIPRSLVDVLKSIKEILKRNPVNFQGSSIDN